MMIAVGIGLHNFAEGLAIGSSAASGELSLALLLVIGFALHHATEGFGIVAPMAGDTLQPSWARLVLLGVIAGGPTLVGTQVGQRVVNDVMSTAFLGLAAGSVLYVVIELLAVARRCGLKELTTWCIVAGLALGFRHGWNPHRRRRLTSPSPPTAFGRWPHHRAPANPVSL